MYEFVLLTNVVIGCRDHPDVVESFMQLHAQVWIFLAEICHNKYFSFCITLHQSAYIYMHLHKFSNCYNNHTVDSYNMPKTLKIIKIDPSPF